MDRDPIIREAAKAVGGVTKLSSALGLSRAAVSFWTRVPAEHVIEVERLTGIPREALRPDLYRRDPAPQVAQWQQPRRQQG